MLKAFAVDPKHNYKNEAGSDPCMDAPFYTQINLILDVSFSLCGKQTRQLELELFP